MTRKQAIEVLNMVETHGLADEAKKMAIQALEQELCEDWYDVPSNEMNLEQARQAVRDLRKKLVDYLWQEPCKKEGDKRMVLINWQYCTDLNDINLAIRSKDDNWEGLTSADDIINITYNSNHNCYVVFWKVER